MPVDRLQRDIRVVFGRQVVVKERLFSAAKQIGLLAHHIFPEEGDLFETGEGRFISRLVVFAEGTIGFRDTIVRFDLHRRELLQ